MLRNISVLAYLVVLAVGVSAQSVYTPDKGSPARKAILDALRGPVERAMKQKIVFVADNFKVQGTWAFVGGSMQTPSGDRPDVSKTEYAEAQEAGAFDSNFFGLLRRTADKWRVVKHAIGCTDVCYAEWWKEARAPKAIFDITY